MKNLIDCTDLFDKIECRWESVSGQRILGTILVLGFLLVIAIIEVNRLGMFPEKIGALLPVKHLAAIEFIFTTLLTFEVVSLIFSLVHSVSTSIGKQFEVLSLVLLRHAFKEFSHLSEPVSWIKIQPVLYAIGTSAVAALMIFVIIGFFYRLQKRPEAFSSTEDKESFILAKKVIALALLAIFLFIVLFYTYNFFTHGDSLKIFKSFYTVLIFSDILIMLISMRYASSYRIAFRNSGFAVGTLLIRFSLIAPIIAGSVIGVGAALFVLGIGYAYNIYTPSSYQLEKERKAPRNVME